MRYNFNMNNPLEHFNQNLFKFLDASPTPFHAAQRIANTLREAGFQPLDLANAWSLQPGGRYYCLREGSIIAFIVGHMPLTQSGMRLFGAHTDSPCLKLKPVAATTRHSYLQLGVEVYGAALLNPWFDRDLSIAGRLVCSGENGLESRLIDFRRPLAIIPSLAIHLDREANNARTINPQQDLPPLVLQCGAGETPDFAAILRQQAQIQYPDATVNEVLGFDLNLYDTCGAGYVGLKQDFIASARLDNLLSCFIGLSALREMDNQGTAMLLCMDNEEVGSDTYAGARSEFARTVVSRICGGEDKISQIMARSLLLSADNTHGIHPNHADRHDDNHAPLLNHGPAIKTNASQRYASNADTAAVARDLARRLNMPLQDFITRSDLRCGGTIGPINAARLGVRTLDIGVPTFAMHSVRELAGREDAYALYRLSKAFFDPAYSISVSL
jgi:aspartyl aminopeptidase